MIELDQYKAHVSMLREALEGTLKLLHHATQCFGPHGLTVIGEPMPRITAQEALSRTPSDSYEEVKKLQAENERLSTICDKWNAECDDMREDNKRLVAERDALSEACFTENQAATMYANQVAHWIGKFDAIKAERDALKVDAERYRFLRRNTDWFDWDIVVQPIFPPMHKAHDDYSVKIDCSIDFVLGNFHE